MHSRAGACSGADRWQSQAAGGSHVRADPASGKNLSFARALCDAHNGGPKCPRVTELPRLKKRLSLIAEPILPTGSTNAKKEITMTRKFQHVIATSGVAMLVACGALASTAPAFAADP